MRALCGFYGDTKSGQKIIIRGCSWAYFNQVVDLKPAVKKKVSNGIFQLFFRGVENLYKKGRCWSLPTSHRRPHQPLGIKKSRRLPRRRAVRTMADSDSDADYFWTDAENDSEDPVSDPEKNDSDVKSDEEGLDACCLPVHAPKRFHNIRIMNAVCRKRRRSPQKETRFSCSRRS